MEQDGLVARVLHEVATAKAGVAASYERLWHRPNKQEIKPANPTTEMDAEAGIHTDSGAASDPNDHQPIG